MFHAHFHQTVFWAMLTLAEPETAAASEESVSAYIATLPPPDAPTLTCTMFTHLVYASVS